MMGHHFSSNDIDSIYDHLKKICSFNDNGRYKEVLVITVQNYDGMLPRECKRGEEIRKKLPDLLDEKGGQFFRFNHGTMYFSTSAYNFPKDTNIDFISQFDKSIDFINKGHDNKSVMQVVLPYMSQIKKTPIPAIISVVLKPKRVDDKDILDIVAIYRQQEFSTWWPLNVLELHEIQKQALDKLLDMYIQGDIITIALQGSWNPNVPLANKSMLDDADKSKDIARKLLVLFTSDIDEKKEIAEKELIEAVNEKKTTTSCVSYDSIGLKELKDTLFKSEKAIESLKKYQEDEKILSRCKQTIKKMDNILNELISLLLECSTRYDRKHKRDANWEKKVDKLFDDLITEIKVIKGIYKNG